MVRFIFCEFCFNFFLKRQGIYVAQAGLKLTILLPLPPQRWDYRHDYYTRLSLQFRRQYHWSENLKNELPLTTWCSVWEALVWQCQSNIQVRRSC
jgi:hypothetical protein